MNVTRTIPRNFAATHLKDVLLDMAKETNKQQELIFPDSMLEDLCDLCCYNYYQFAHDLKNQPYMRVKMYDINITLEYLTVTNPESDGGTRTLIIGVSEGGVLRYSRPDNPVGTILIVEED